MDFFLFCLLNAVLFLRPAELVPSLIGLPIYQVVIVLNLIACFPAILNQLQYENLRRSPITLCVLGVLVAIPLSHLRHLDTWNARFSFMDYGKTVLYFLCFVSVVNSERRLNQFFGVLLVLLAFMTSLSLLHHRGAIYLPQLDSLGTYEIDGETGAIVSMPRLQSTGLFNDPNDFAMVLAIGMVLSLSFLSSSGMLVRPLWLIALGILGYALYLTQSRGGILALIAGSGVFAYFRWGWKKAAFAGCLMLPLVAAVFAMRDDGGLESGTGQSRIQIWAEGFSLWKNTFMFGIGQGKFGDEVGHVAHNSFLQCYVELGLIGGTLFFGTFYFSIRTLLLQRLEPEIERDEISKRRTTLSLAIACAAATSMLSLSRSYGVPAHMVLGLAAATISLNAPWAPLTMPEFNYQNSRRLAIASVAFVIATFLFMKTMVRWS